MFIYFLSQVKIMLAISAASQRKVSSAVMASIQNPILLHAQRKSVLGEAISSSNDFVGAQRLSTPYVSSLKDVDKSLKLKKGSATFPTVNVRLDIPEKPELPKAPKPPKEESVEGDGEHTKQTDTPPADSRKQNQPAVAPKALASGAEKVPKSPDEDLAFQDVIKGAKVIANKQKGHPSPKLKAQEALSAARPPPNGRIGKAKEGLVSGMKQSAEHRPGFDRAAFIKALEAAINSIPKITDEDEAKDFKKSNAAAPIRQQVAGSVQESKNRAQGPVENAANAPINVKGIEEEKPGPPAQLQPGNAPPKIDAAMATPKPRPESEISMEEDSRKIDQDMDDADVTEEQLESSNEPEFQGAVAEKKDIQTRAKEAPVAYRQDEESLLDVAKEEATNATGKGMQSIHAVRKNQFKDAHGQQLNSQSKKEQEEIKIVNDIENMYKETQKSVNDRLALLDSEVDGIFNKGAKEAKDKFENHVNEVAEYYSGLGGKAKKVWHYFSGTPEWVEKCFVDGRKMYVDHMNGVIGEIATAVETGLNEASAIIDRGWDRIQSYKKGLARNLVDFADEAIGKIENKFDKLRESVDNKFNNLVDTLAKKYSDNMKKVDERITQMKEDLKPGIAKVIDAIKEVVKTILKLKDMLFSVLTKVGSVVTKIIKHPISFLGNLVKGVKVGLSNFTGKIGYYLEQGMFEWLFGEMTKTGIQMPKEFDFKGILSLVLQALGLTYPAIRARAVGILGEGVVKKIEGTSEIFMALVSEGPAGLWKYIQEKMADLKEMVIEGIKGFLKERVIIAGITWIVGLLNPASAFIKAAKAIYDIVMFFVTRGSEIEELVDAILDSMDAIANGSIGVAAAAVEKALGKAVPVVIGFLASLLGLGGIGEKIRNIIQKMQAPVNKAVDWVINKASSTVKKIGKLAATGAEALVDWWKEKESFSNNAGERHTLSFRGTGDNAQLVIASEVQTVQAYLASYKDKDSADYITARTVFDRSSRIIFTPQSKTKDEKERRKVVKQELAKLSAAFAKLVGAPPKDSDYPKSTEPTYDPYEIEYLVGEPKSPGTKPGKGPNTGTPGWKEVYEAGLTTASDKWVQMHVISEQLGGKGIPANLVPAPNSINTGSFRSFEHQTKALAKAKSGNIKNVVWAKFEVKRSGIFAKSIRGMSGLWFWKGQNALPKWLRNEKYSYFSQATIPEPQLGKEKKISLNFSSGTDLKTITNDSKLIKIIKENRLYPSLAVFVKRVEARADEAGVRDYKNKIQSIVSNKEIVLNAPSSES